MSITSSAATYGTLAERGHDMAWQTPKKPSDTHGAIRWEIEQFHRICRSREYTDTDSVWFLLEWIWKEVGGDGNLFIDLPDDYKGETHEPDTD